MDVLGRVLVLSHKSGLSQISWNALRPRLRPRLRPSQLCLPLSKMMNSYWHRGVEFSPAQHAASTIPTQTVPAGMNNLAPQSHQNHDSHNRHQQSSFTKPSKSRQPQQKQLRKATCARHFHAASWTDWFDCAQHITDCAQDRCHYLKTHRSVMEYWSTFYLER